MTSKVTLPKFNLKEFSSPAGPRSPAERLWIVGGVLAGLVLVLIGYFALISPQRSETSSVRSQVSAAQAQQAALTSRISTLRSQFKNLAKYEAQLASAQAALPTGSGVPALLRALQSAGAATATSVSNISIGVPTAVVTQSSTTGTTTTGTTTGSTTTGTTTSGTSTSGTTSTSSGTAAVATSTGVYSMVVSAQISGSDANLDKFLVQLQRVQPRAVLITTLNLSAGTAETGKNATTPSTLSLSMLTFMMPATSSTTGTTSTSTGTSP